MAEQLFVYGTLRQPEVQIEIIGREVELVADSLTGFKTEPITLDGVTYRILVPATDAEVAGSIIFITQDELERIDAYEPDDYKRISVTTASGKTAWVYFEARSFRS